MEVNKRIIDNINRKICCISKKQESLDEVIFFSNIGTNDLLPLAVPGLPGKLYVNIDTGESFIANHTGMAPYYISVGKDVTEAIDHAALPTTGETSKIYVTLDNNKLYRWTGSTYVEVSPNTIPIYIQLAASDETTALTTGTGKVTFRVPSAFTLISVRASLTTAQASGSIFTVDINQNGTSILSTKLTIDNTEKTSTTASTASVISTSAITDDAEITIDIDQIGNGTAKGLKITLIGTK